MNLLTVAFLCLISTSIIAPKAFASPEDEFRFRFAMLGSQDGVSRTLYLQGEHGSEDAMRNVCGLSGLACACEIFDQAGNLLERSERLSYDLRGNYFRCVPSAAHPTAAYARVVERRSGGLAGPRLPLETSQTLTLADLLGGLLDQNLVRGIYRYTCEFNFLQKQGTTTQSFDCSNQSTSCDPDGAPSKNLCLLKARFPYHLFADSYSTNFQHRVPDRLYNGGGSGRICGMQLKQFDCSGIEHIPVRSFGLFGEQTGYWDTSLQLAAGPDLTPTIYGFAARTSADTGECPPGLEKRVIFRADVVTSDITPSHNFASGLPAAEVALASATLPAFGITKLSGGNGGRCDGSSCSLPNSYAGLVKSFGYSSAGETEFCVIPAEMLP